MQRNAICYCLLLFICNFVLFVLLFVCCLLFCYVGYACSASFNLIWKQGHLPTSWLHHCLDGQQKDRGRRPATRMAALRRVGHRGGAHEGRQDAQPERRRTVRQGRGRRRRGQDAGRRGAGPHAHRSWPQAHGDQAEKKRFNKDFVLNK